MPSAVIHLNGELVPEHLAMVSCLDRGFLYGDGLFETVRVRQARPFRLGRHLERLRRGLEFLGIQPGVSDEALAASVEELIRANAAVDAVLRVTVSRGVGGRGYSTRDATLPTVVLSLHPLPPIDPLNPVAWRLKTASIRLASGQELTRHKTANKLPQILARQEAEMAGMDEALLLNERGWLVEGASGNVFWIHAGRVTTPFIEAGALPGISRGMVMELCGALDIPSGEGEIGLEEFRRSEGAFLSMSTLGVVAVAAVDGVPMGQSPLVSMLHQAFQAMTE